MYQVAGILAEAIKYNWGNAAQDRNRTQQQTNSGIGSGMATGQAPAMTQTPTYTTKIMTDVAMPGMGDTMENNTAASLIAPFMQTEKAFMSPTTQQPMGAASRGMTVDQIKQALFGRR